jgi:Xylose isomerase-like TIM barrel
MKDTARTAARLGVSMVVGFAGSSIWHTVAIFPTGHERGNRGFAHGWNPILGVFDKVGVRFTHEVHPSEIAYDYWTTVRILDAIGHRPAFGLNFDPGHFVWQDLDPLSFLWDFRDRIYNVDCKEWVKQLNGRNGRLGSHLLWADPAPRLGLRVHRAWRRPMGGLLPHAQRDRLRRPHLGRVGGRRHGPAHRWARMAGYGGIERIYVIDASLHFTNGGGNPALTIMTLAWRSAAYIAGLTR